MTSYLIPRSIWSTGIRHEALRLIYYLTRLPQRELQNRGFLVLPAIPPKYAAQTIVFPDLNFSHLWKSTSRLHPATPMTAPDHLIESVSSLLTTYSPPRQELASLKNKWHSVERKFFAVLYSLLPESRNRIQKIEFIITRWGTVSQFNMLLPQHSILTLYLRPDAAIGDIAQAIILSLIRHQLQYRQSRRWEEIETVSDFLLHHSPLARIIKPKSSTMMSALRQPQTGKLLLKSQKFQARLGVPTVNNWQIKNKNIFFQDIKIKHLTQRQFQLLQLFIVNYGEIVSNDLIADLLWPESEKFSLWAIVKEIARIREKIVISGLPGSLLKSHRKLGYSLI